MNLAPPCTCLRDPDEPCVVHGDLEAPDLGLYPATWATPRAEHHRRIAALHVPLTPPWITAYIASNASGRGIVDHTGGF